ncbi:TRAP transporter substrate-binding protein DctP, partial [bacterium]|nr:TRAP transporter substrate-binding protein DctP [bacterium]
RTIFHAALAAGEAWQNKELLSQEASLVSTLKSQGMTVIEPDLAQWRKLVLDTVPKKFEDKWGKGTFEALLAL